MTILPGLKFVPQVSFYSNNSDGRFFQLSGLINGVNGYSAARNASGYYNKRIQYQADATLSYNKSFERNNIEAIAGYAFYQNSISTLGASGRGAATDLVTTLNAASTPLSVSGMESNHIMVGYFSRVNYDFDQKYLFSLNARYDGASNLGDKY